MWLTTPLSKRVRPRFVLSRTGHRRREAQRQRPRIEFLEDRQLLSGSAQSVYQTVTDSGGKSATSSIVAKVAMVAPTATESAPSSGNVGTALSFTASATDPSSVDMAAGFTYNWNFGDNTTGTSANPTHTYTATGTYTVSVTATDQDGAVSTPATASVVIAPASSIVASAGSSFSVNEGTKHAFAGTVTGGVAPYTYAWVFGDTTTGSGANPSHTYADKGTYTSTLTVTDSKHSTASASVVATVNNVAPTAAVTGPIQGKTGTALSFTATATDPSSVATAAGFTYNWNFGDGTTATAHGSTSTLTHTYTGARTYTLSVTATDKDGGVSTAATLTECIYAGGGALTLSAGGAVSTNEGTAITFGATLSGGTGPYTFYWNYGDGTTATTPTLNPTYTYQDNGTYHALVYVTDSNGLTASSAVTVTAANVAPTVTVTGPPSGSTGANIYFMVSATDPSPTDWQAGFTYNWNFGDGKAGSGTGLEEALSHTYTTAGTYTVSAMATDKNGATSATATTTIAIAAATVIPIDQTWLQNHGPAPYQLTQAGAIYRLQTDVTTSGTAFKITQSNIRFDLNGHTITYDNAQPISVANGGFETGHTSGWDMSQAPNATVAPAMLGMYGNWMLSFPNITANQTFVSSPITVPQANIPYIAGIQAKAVDWGTTKAAFTVIDSVTQAVLGTSAGMDPGGGPILKVTFTPTTTNPVILKVDVIPTAGRTKPSTSYFDYACLYRVNIYGVDISYRQVSVVNGTITQGQGHSAISPAVFAYGSTIMLDGITAYASGMDTNIIYGNWSKGATIKNCNLVGGLDQISNRMAANAEIYLLASAGVIDIENNHLSGSHQGGIVMAGSHGTSSFTNILIKGNDIRLDSSWTDGYAIGIGAWSKYFDVAYNTIVPISGRGILLDSSSLITNGTIHDNFVQVQERGNLEYGQGGLIATALRMRNWDGTISNLNVYNNTFSAYTGIGPGIPAHADYAAAGARIGFYNDHGQMNNCNVTFQNNLFKAIVASRDPNIGSNAAWGFSFPRYDAGMGVKWINNTCESNHIALNFGDSDGINESDITMIGTTIVKSTEGHDMTFSSMMVGNWGSTVHNVRMIDTVFQNGAPSTPTFDGTAAKDISLGYSLTVHVVDSHGNPVSGATASLFDSSGNLLYSGTTDANGLLGIIPLFTTTDSVAKNGNDAKPTITTTQNFTVKAKSGSRTGILSVTLTGDPSVQVVVQ